MFWLQAFLMLLCGAALSLAMPPIGLWFCFLALIPLFIVVATAERPRVAFWQGFFFALGFFAVNLFWLPNSLSKLFGGFIWATFPPMLLILGCFWGMVTLFSRLWGGQGFGTLWLLPPLWLLMEWARTHGPFAFPWGSLGYLWLGTPVAEASDLAGSYGLSLLTLLVISLLSTPFINTEGRTASFGLRSRRAWWAIPVSIGLLGLAAVYGLIRLEHPLPELDRSVLLVQGNTDPMGRMLGQTDDVTVYTDLTRNAVSTAVSPPELVVWPEGAVINEATLEGDAGEALRQRLQASVGSASLITGMSLWEDDDQGTPLGYNRVYGLADATVTDKYDKIGLVPFGEGLPFYTLLRPLYNVIYPLFGLGAYTRVPGELAKPLTVSDLTAAVYICYESVFPHIIREQVKRGGEVLVNITNDSWFGAGSGGEQHFLMGTMRAIETKRYLLRAGNDGVTAVVDPHGRTLTRLERHISSSIIGEYALMTGQTLYVRWGDWIVWLAAIYAVIVIVVQMINR